MLTFLFLLNVGQAGTNYPDAVIGLDYGLITEADRAASEIHAYPSKFSEDSTSPYPFWKCYKNPRISVHCDGNKKDALLVFSVKTPNETNEYLARKVFERGFCVEWAILWQPHRHEKTVCFAGEFLQKDPGRTPTYAWFFDRFKTRKGCESYFGNACPD